MLRRSAIRRVNRARKARLQAKQFGEQAALCRTLPCCVCGSRPAVPHHVVSRGAGGLDRDCAPLCPECHLTVHFQGWQSFQREWGVDLAAVARELAGRV